MKPFLFLVAVCMMLLMSSTGGYAQSGHVYEDSSVLYPDQTVPAQEQNVEVVEAPQETIYNNSSTATETDTDFVSNRHFLSPDSLTDLKNEKPLLYAKNLDSLLKDLQKKEQLKLKESTGSRDESNPIPGAATPLESFFNAAGTQYFLWGAAGLFVLFILYKLFFAGGIFQKSTTKNHVLIPDEEELTPVAGRNFDTAIAKAKAEKNYRFAIRYLYLQLLQRLSANGAIEFAADKTNTEYVRELTGKPYKEEVAALTMYYEYAWYGEFGIDEDKYSKIESRYRNLVI